MKKNHSCSWGGVRTSVPTLLTLALLQATSVLAESYTGPDNLYVSSDLTYDIVDIDSTINNNYIVDVFDPAILNVTKSLSITAKDAETPSSAYGVSVTGPGQVIVGESTNISFESTATESTGEETFIYGILLSGGAKANLGSKKSLITMSSALACLLQVLINLQRIRQPKTAECRLWRDNSRNSWKILGKTQILGVTPPYPRECGASSRGRSGRLIFGLKRAPQRPGDRADAPATSGVAPCAIL